MLTHPFIRTCKYQLPVPIQLPSESHTHILLVNLDRDWRTLSQAFAGHYFCFTSSLPSGQSCPHAYEAVSQRIIFNSSLRTGKYQPNKNNPLQLQFPAKKDGSWPFFYFIHSFGLKEETDFDEKIDFCEERSEKPKACLSLKFVDLLQEMQIFSICISAKNALNFNKRKQIKDTAEKIKQNIKQNINNSENNSIKFPELVITLTDQEHLFNRVFNNDQIAISSLKEKEIDKQQEILQGYILYTCALKEEIAPLWDLPWKKRSFTMCGNSFESDVEQSVAGMRSWTRMMYQKMM